MSITVDQWAGDLLAQLGAPNTFANRRFLSAWAYGENTKARFNPLATTWSMPGDSFFNTFGDHGQYHVRNYAGYGDGLHATVNTLRNGRYALIVAQLGSGAVDLDNATVRAELDTWGTGGEHVRTIHQSGGPPETWGPPSLVDVREPARPVPPVPVPPALPKEPQMVIVVSKEHHTGYSVSGGVWTVIDDKDDLSAAINALPHFEWSAATIAKHVGR